MKLFDNAVAPNPRRVRIFLAEKGLSIERVPVDLMALEHQGEAYRAVNPRARVPALMLDDGTVIAETMAICRYIEALHPEPALLGTGALEQALIEMWQRRIEFELLLPAAHVFRHTRRSMAMLEVPQIPAWAEANRPRIMDFLEFLDGHLAGRAFVMGERFSVADITGLVAVDLLDWGKITVPARLAEVLRWHRALSGRPSATA